jgi:hypothetical protein
MRINFSEEETQYITTYFLMERESIKPIFEKSGIDIDEDLADEIIDWAGERQQIIGFDENYNLNNLGKLLDGIIDKLAH